MNEKTVIEINKKNRKKKDKEIMMINTDCLLILSYLIC